MSILKYLLPLLFLASQWARAEVYECYARIWEEYYREFPNTKVDYSVYADTKKFFISGEREINTVRITNEDFTEFLKHSTLKSFQNTSLENPFFAQVHLNELRSSDGKKVDHIKLNVSLVVHMKDLGRNVSLSTGSGENNIKESPKNELNGEVMFELFERDDSNIEIKYQNKIAFLVRCHKQ